MADFHRPYRGESRPSFGSDSAFPHANGFGSALTANNHRLSGAGDRRIEIYTTPPPPPRALALPPPPAAARREGGGDGGGGGGSMWCFSDPEMKRRRRVASYKAYSVEGKVKASLRRGLQWFKGKCSEIFHGW